MSHFDDPTPHDEPIDVDDLFAMAAQAEAEEHQADNAFLARVQDVPGLLGQLLREIAQARVAWRNAERWGGTTGGEGDRLLPIIDAAQELVDDLTGGVSA